MIYIKELLYIRNGKTKTTLRNIRVHGAAMNIIIYDKWEPIFEMAIVTTRRGGIEIKKNHKQKPEVTTTATKIIITNHDVWYASYLYLLCIVAFRIDVTRATASGRADNIKILSEVRVGGAGVGGVRIELLY